MARCTTFDTTRLRTVVGSLMAVLAAVLYTAGPSASTANAASFTLFNNTSYPNANLEQYGLVDSSVVYDQWQLTCSTTSCSNVPSQSTFQSAVKSYVSRFHASASAPITLDFEKIVPVDASSSAQAQQEVNLWKKLITWAHSAEPSAKIGMYSYDYDNSNSSYTKQLYASGYLNYFAPSMYTRWSSMSTWSSELSAAVSHDHSVNSGLAIYPYIWPQSDSTSGEPFTDGTTWRSELDQIKAKTSGAIVWSGTTALNSSANGWIAQTKAFMTSIGG